MNTKLAEISRELKEIKRDLDIVGKRIDEILLSSPTVDVWTQPASVDAPADLTGDTLIQQPMPSVVCMGDACEAGA